MGAAKCGLRTALYVEADPVVAEACAKTHAIPMLSPQHALDMLQAGELPKSFVLNADAASNMSMFFIGIMQCDAWLASPPCQPWSKAGVLMGLASNDGVMFPRLIAMGALMKARFILAENVPGICEHPHYVQIKAYVAQVGWRCVLSSQDKVFPLLPIMRNRWLGMFVPCTQYCNPHDIERASSFKIPDSIPGIGTHTSVGCTGSVQYNLESWEKEQALPSDDALQLMSVYNLLPSNIRTKVLPTTPHSEILKLRVRTPRQPYPNVMAQHGVQHELPIKHLRQKGLHAFLLDVDGVLRFPTPYELSSSMGYNEDLILPSAFRKAWHIVGNGLTIAHAMLACYRAHVVLANFSPFTCQWDSIDKFCAEIKASVVDLSDFFTETDGKWMKLKPITLRKNPPVDEPPFEQEVFTPDFVDVPPTKRMCISPTWEFEEEENESPVLIVDHHAYPNCANKVGTVFAEDASLLLKQQCPYEHEIQHLIGSGDIEHVDGEHIAILLHDQGIWYRPVWRAESESISTTIRKALPHAKAEMFEAICIGGTEVTFRTIPIGTTTCDIFFTPKFFTRIVVTNLLSKDLPIQVDATWTVADLISYVAAEAAVLSHNLVVIDDGAICHPEAFVLAIQQTVFNVRYKQYMLPKECLKFAGNHPHQGKPVVDVEIEEVPIPTFQNELKGHAKADEYRFAFRVPKWNIIRTVTCIGKATFA
eukprot:Skav232155  [mRNA]  locus=scaffold1040:417886:419997:- [translate_table: standard]